MILFIFLARVYFPLCKWVRCEGVVLVLPYGGIGAGDWIPGLVYPLSLRYASAPFSSFLIACVLDHITEFKMSVQFNFLLY